MENEDEESGSYDEEDDYSDENDDVDEGDSRKKKKASKPAGCREILIRWGALGNFVMQVANIVLQHVGTPPPDPWEDLSSTEQATRGMIYTSSALGAINSPIIVYKERLLTNEDTFRSALNGIREEQGRLADQNDILSGEIDELESEVDRLKDVEQALGQLADTQGSQLNELMELIAENKKINEGLRSVLKAKVLEEVIGLVLDIDNDGSFTIQDKEIDRLVIGMRLIDDMTFKENVFRKQVLSCDGNVDEVILLIKNLIRGAGKDSQEENTMELAVDPEEYFAKQRGG